MILDSAPGFGAHLNDVNLRAENKISSKISIFGIN